jgi:inorganic pyrophosphatase
MRSVKARAPSAGAGCSADGRENASVGAVAVYGGVMNPWHDLSPGNAVPRVVDAFVEIPRGGRVKYEIDKESGVLRASRVLYGALHYPANYGFIPRTLDDDGDPLDILVLSQDEVVPGCLVSARVIGVMPMVDQGDVDDKIIAVMVGDPMFEGVRSLDDLAPFRMNEIMRFFGDYKALEEKEVRVAAPLGLDEAVKVVERTLGIYQQRFGPPKSGPRV